MEYLYKELVEEAKRGCSVAMETLIEKLHPLIYSTINRFRRNREVEDLYQESCILLIEALRDFDEERGVPFLAFAKSRIHFGIYNLTRKDVFEQSLDQPQWEEDGQSLLEGLVDMGPGVEELVARGELSKDLNRALKSLTDKQRDVIIGHYFKGKKLKDIAIDRGVHYKTVLQLKNRAIKELYGRLEDLG